MGGNLEFDICGDTGGVCQCLPVCVYVVATVLPSRPGADMANFLTWASDVLEKVDQSAASLSDTAAQDRLGR